MATFSHKKVSFLGLALFAASALTAAIMPKGKTEKKVGYYELTMSICYACSVQLTCSITDVPNVGAAACNYTEDSNTSEDFDTSLTTGLDHHTIPGTGTAEGSNTSASPC